MGELALYIKDKKQHSRSKEKKSLGTSSSVAQQEEKNMKWHYSDGQTIWWSSCACFFWKGYGWPGNL